MSVCLITACDAQAAQAVRRALDDELRIVSDEDMVVRAIDSSVVLAFSASTTRDPHVFIDGANELLSSLACEGLVLDDDDDGWRWLVDGTGGVSETLGADDDALKAFLDLLPGTCDSLDNLARVAVAITAPASGRPAPVAGSAMRVTVPGRPAGRER